MEEASLYKRGNLKKWAGQHENSATLIGCQRNWKQVHHFLTYLVGEHIIKTFKVSAGQSEVK